MKEDERRFLKDVYKKCGVPTGEIFVFGFAETYSPRDLINEPDFYMHYKRAWYLLEKWSGKGWYEWGVTMDLGWLTPKGKSKAVELNQGEVKTE